MGRGRAVLLSAVGVALLAGCGGSQLSASSFRAKANAVCASYRAAVTKVPLPHTIAGYELYARRTLPLYRTALASLEALEPPKKDAPLVSRWLARDRTIEQDVVRIARIAHTRRLPELNAAVSRARLDDQASSELAAKLGLDVCAKA